MIEDRKWARVQCLRSVGMDSKFILGCNNEQRDEHLNGPYHDVGMISLVRLE